MAQVRESYSELRVPVPFKRPSQLHLKHLLHQAWVRCILGDHKRHPCCCVEVVSRPVGRSNICHFICNHIFIVIHSGVGDIRLVPHWHYEEFHFNADVLSGQVQVTEGQQEGQHGWVCISSTADQEADWNMSLKS
uniref:Uncharacterized protein n=1 Tax=Anguilla anguilla TaxID=7936 RepID=A0A0E9X1D4_ANGAN